MMGKEKSVTFLGSWICHAPYFPRTSIQLEGWKYTCLPLHTKSRFSANISIEDKTVARRDIPHGIAVKTTACVNMLVLYSPSVGKVLIVAMKAMGPQTRSHTAGVSAVPECNTDLMDKRNTNDVARRWGTEHRNDSFCLIKCVVVDRLQWPGVRFASFSALSRFASFSAVSHPGAVWRTTSLSQNVPLVGVDKHSKRRAISKKGVSITDLNNGVCVRNFGAMMVETETGSNVDVSKNLASREVLFDSLQQAGKFQVKPALCLHVCSIMFTVIQKQARSRFAKMVMCELSSWNWRLMSPHYISVG